MWKPVIGAIIVVCLGVVFIVATFNNVTESANTDASATQITLPLQSRLNVRPPTHLLVWSPDTQAFVPATELQASLIQAISYAINYLGFGSGSPNLVITGPLGTTSIDTTGVNTQSVWSTYIDGFKVSVTPSHATNPVEYIATMDAANRAFIFEALAQIMTAGEYTEFTAATGQICGVTTSSGYFQDASKANTNPFCEVFGDGSPAKVLGSFSSATLETIGCRTDYDGLYLWTAKSWTEPCPLTKRTIVKSPEMQSMEDSGVILGSASWFTCSHPNMQKCLNGKYCCCMKGSSADINGNCNAD